MSTAAVAMHTQTHTCTHTHTHPYSPHVYCCCHRVIVNSLRSWRRRRRRQGNVQGVKKSIPNPVLAKATECTRGGFLAEVTNNGGFGNARYVNS